MQAQLKQEEVALSQYTATEIVHPEVIYPLLNSQVNKQQVQIKKMDDAELDQFIRETAALGDCV